MAKNIDLDALKLLLDELKANGQIGYEETVLGDTLTWDGTDSDVVVDLGGGLTYQLVSEVLPPIDFIKSSPNGNTTLSDGTISSNVGCEDEYSYYVGMTVLVYEENHKSEQFIFPKKGVYFMKSSIKYVSSLTIEGANCFPTSTPKQIDSKYLLNNNITFIVNSSDSSVTCNKTYEEILQMWNSVIFGSINIKSGNYLRNYNNLYYTGLNFLISYNDSSTDHVITFKKDGTIILDEAK